VTGAMAMRSKKKRKGVGKRKGVASKPEPPKTGWQGKTTGRRAPDRRPRGGAWEGKTGGRKMPKEKKKNTGVAREAAMSL